MLQATLYTRRGCHLCDDAKAVLERNGVPFREVDVDQDADLRARYNECVPVVAFGDKERFRGRVDEVLLRRFIRHGDG